MQLAGSNQRVSPAPSAVSIVGGAVTRGIDTGVSIQLYAMSYGILWASLGISV